jgi:serine protease
MKLPLFLSAALLAAALWAVPDRVVRAGPLPFAAAGQPQAVDGLIVKLRLAPTQQALRADAGHARTLAQGAAAASLGAVFAGRWQQVLQDSGLASEAGVRLRPAGSASQLLLPAPGRRWTAAEAAQRAARLAALPDVEWVVPNTREQRLQVTLPIPDDPLFGGLANQWWLQPVGGSNANSIEARLRGVPGIQSAWAQGMGSADVVVAVLDTGITPHPDLPAERLWPGFDFVSDWDAATGRGYANDGDGRDADPSDPGDEVTAADIATDPARYSGCAVAPSSWHGTVVAGIVAAAADNALGVAGIDWLGRVLPVRVAGKCGADVQDIVDGMRWAAGLTVCQTYADTQDPSAGCQQWAPVNAHPARIVNISFGGAAACNAEYQSAVDELWALGVVVVAAAGNDAASPTRPANCTHAIGVAALNRDGFKASYSNFGPVLRIATVGGDDSSGQWGALLSDSGLLTLNNDGASAPGMPGYAHHYGTSFATPVVAGTLGLMLAADPALTAQQLSDGLAVSARPHVTSPKIPVCSAGNPGRCICTTATCGAGILDAEQAVRYAQALAARVPYQAPSWPTVVIDNPEVDRAVSLGPDREAPAATPPVSGTPPAETPGSGGGALGGGFVGLLVLAGVALGRRRPRPGAERPDMPLRR